MVHLVVVEQHYLSRIQDAPNELRVNPYFPMMSLMILLQSVQLQIFNFVHAIGDKGNKMVIDMFI